MPRILAMGTTSTIAFACPRPREAGTGTTEKKNESNQEKKYRRRSFFLSVDTIKWEVSSTRSPAHRISSAKTGSSTMPVFSGEEFFFSDETIGLGEYGLSEDSSSFVCQSFGLPRPISSRNASLSASLQVHQHRHRHRRRRRRTHCCLRRCFPRPSDVWAVDFDQWLQDCKKKSTIHGGGSTSVNGCTSASSLTIFKVVVMGCSGSGSGLETVSDNGSDDDDDGPVVIGDTDDAEDDVDDDDAVKPCKEIYKK
jgi:hypothetical protein